MHTSEDFQLTVQAQFSDEVVQRKASVKQLKQAFEGGKREGNNYIDLEQLV